MADTKRIIIKLPNSLLEEVDNLVSINKNNRNEFIKRAMKLYIREQRMIEIKETMKQGYLEMSQININLSEMGLTEDMRELNVYETNLTGCEK